MPAIDKTSLITRLRYTAISQLLNGRISNGLTPAQVISRARLEPPVHQLITLICKRTRLWNDERVEVAQELISHFLDAKEAGIPTERATRDFGNPDDVAVLIRRAKIRNRSLVWHALRFTRRLALALVLLYLCLIVYYAIGTPRIAVDYVAQINAPILKIPADQRAWPYYRQLAEAMKVDAEARGASAFDIVPNVSDRKWPQVKGWLKEHPNLLELADQATSRPSMGFVYGTEGSVRELKEFQAQTADPNDPLSKSMINLLLPQLNQMRQTANLLASDARLAAEEQDSSRWLRRIGQIQQVGEHSADSGFLIGHLVRVGVEALRLKQIQDVLVAQPQLLSDEQLIALAHSNTRYRKPGDLISYASERMLFMDIVQRVYTDDGNGDGRVTASGLASIERLGALSQPPSRNTTPRTLARLAVTPAAAMLLASRKDLVEKYDYFLTRMERNINVPWREWRTDNIDDEIRALKAGPIDQFRYVLISILMPSLERASLTAQRCIVARDAVQVGIALELYRRRNGSYPPTLDTLTPGLLPFVPADPADGQALRYKLVEGKPVVYSIGADLDDDGGIPPAPKPGRPQPNRVINGSELAIGADGAGFDGDWILFPELRSTEPDEDEEPPVEASTAPSTQPATD